MGCDRKLKKKEHGSSANGLKSTRIPLSTTVGIIISLDFPSVTRKEKSVI